jgi:hypothetical protein
MKCIALCLVLSILVPRFSFSQNTAHFINLPFNNLDSFRSPGKNWNIAADAAVEYTKPHDMKALPGHGAVVNLPGDSAKAHLFTKNEFGDLELELDFMMAKNSNSGVYLQGRYEIQLLDSWTRLQASASDAGGIYLRWKKERGVYEGTPPLMNVARAPGLWQHLLIRFRAPRFNEKGEKIRNARFEQVFLNGVLVQQQAEVTGPTGSSMFQDERPIGPVVLQGDHGPVAFKNFRYRDLKPPEVILHRPQNWTEMITPVAIVPGVEPYVLRSFMYHGDKKLTHVVSTGTSSQVHYSYDLKRGALFQIWRGDFLDASPMWNQRGEQQVARPLGSVISLSDAPSVAVLVNEQATWPDSVGFDEVLVHGYTLDKQRSPIFRYKIFNTEIRDSISAQVNREGITRTVTAANAPANLYYRIAAGTDIKTLSENLYAIDGRNYYIQVDKKFKPVVRLMTTGQEIIVKYDPGTALTYSIIW